MLTKRLKQKAHTILTHADILPGGDRAWDIHIQNDGFYHRVFSDGTLGLGEAYMDGWWDAIKLDEFMYKAIRNRLNNSIGSAKLGMRSIAQVLWNLQTQQHVFKNCGFHYNLGNELYRRMLDKRMIYSCGYWKDAQTLDEAQTNKLRLVAEKLNLQPGMQVLDIGCGWGGTAAFLAKEYGVDVTGITVSSEQVDMARETCKGLPVEIKLQDYRDTKGKYDRIVSIGMFEHVGEKNYETFMHTARNCLNERGIMLLHTIGSNTSNRYGDHWIRRYIFPNSMLPSARQITNASENHFVLEDWHNFGFDYDKTLMSWFNNFDGAWDHLKDHYDDRFYRMWKYYLLSCAAAFRARSIQLWQIVLSPSGVEGGYQSIR